MLNMQKNRGIVQMFIIFILVVIIVSLVDIKLTHIFKNETLKENFAFLSKGFVYAWNHWLEAPVMKVWAWIRELVGHSASETLKNVWERTFGMFRK